MSQVFAHDKFILIGAVPLLAVNNMTLEENFKIPEIGKGDKSQWLGKVGYSVSIDGVLVGPERFADKARLEVMADLAMVLTTTVPVPGMGGIPLVSDLTTLTDMQITSLRFTQTNQEFEAIGVSLSLRHCPKGFVAELIGRGLNMGASLAGSAGNVAAGVRSVLGPLG